MKNNSIDLVIFTCQGREHLIKNTYNSFKNAYPNTFANVILAIDGPVNHQIIHDINPDLVVVNLKRKGYVNNIVNAISNVKSDFFFWLEDDWFFHKPLDLETMVMLLKTNKNWVEIVYSKTGILKLEEKKNHLIGDFYENTYGFSANPCVCRTSAIKYAFDILLNSEKGGKLGEDGFENFLTKTFKKENKICVLLDPVDHLPISHEGYLESTARNWHMTNSLEKKTTKHLLTIPKPSFVSRLKMLVKLIIAFVNLGFKQLYNNKIYEYCFRIIATSKTVTNDKG